MEEMEIAKIFGNVRKSYKAWDLRLKFGEAKISVPEEVPHINVHEGRPEVAFKEVAEKSEEYWNTVKMDEIDYPVTYKKGRIIINPSLINTYEEAWYYTLIGFFMHRVLRRLSKREMSPYEEILLNINAHAEALKRLRMGAPLQGNVIEMAALRAVASKEVVKSGNYVLALLEPSDSVRLLFGSPPAEINVKLEKLLESNDEFIKKLTSFTLLVDSPKRIEVLH